MGVDERFKGDEMGLGGKRKGKRERWKENFRFRQLAAAYEGDVCLKEDISKGSF